MLISTVPHLPPPPHRGCVHTLRVTHTSTPSPKGVPLIPCPLYRISFPAGPALYRSVPFSRELSFEKFPSQLACLFVCLNRLKNPGKWTLRRSWNKALLLRKRAPSISRLVKIARISFSFPGQFLLCGTWSIIGLWNWVWHVPALHFAMAKGSILSDSAMLKNDWL